MIILNDLPADSIEIIGSGVFILPLQANLTEPTIASIVNNILCINDLGTRVLERV